MLPSNRLSLCRVIATGLLALSACTGMGAAQEASSPALPPSAPSANPPIFIFLNGPADLEAFWKRWNQPDFVLQKGSEYQKLFEAARQDGGAARRASINSLAVRGEVVDDLAHLSLELGLVVGAEEAVWAPIGLEDLTLTDAREETRELPLRYRQRSWEIALEGEGAHAVRLDLLVPVKPTADGRRIELVIPPAASTQIQLDVPHQVLDATAGARDLVTIEPIEAGQRTRLSAHLSPRNRLEVSWRLAAAPGQQLQPLLEARGEIAIEVDLAAIRTQATWSVTCTRGSVSELAFSVDPEDALLATELDGQPLAVESRLEKGSRRVTIPLAESLRVGRSRRVHLVTRRALPAGTNARWVFGGYPLADAAVQTGIVAVGQNGNLWVESEPGRGVRQIDLRELPGDLRSRPSITRAFQFLDQPFELALRAEAAGPHVRVESRATAMVDPRMARLDAWLDYQVTRAAVFELEVRLPRGLDLDSVGPESVVESYHWLPENAGRSLPNLVQSDRLLRLRVTPKARDEGSFRIHLMAHQVIDPSGRLELAMFQPRGASSAGGRIAVVAARNVSADLPQSELGTGPAASFTPAGLEPPDDWPWPAEAAPSSAAPGLWLRYDGNPAFLPLVVTVQPRTVHHETTIAAQVERRRIDVVQETTCHVHYGVLTRLDISVPPAIEGLWDFDGDEVSTSERLKVDPDGQIRYRLTLRREVADVVRLKFRYRIPLEPPLAPAQTTTLTIPWLAVLEGSASGPRLSLSADAGIQLEPAAQGWVRALQSGSGAAAGQALTLIRVQAAAGPPAVRASARALENLPALVASRLWIRTALGSEGRLRNTAWYRLEAHDRSIALALPPGGEWVRALVGSQPLTQVEQIPGKGFRLYIPPGTPAGPVSVGLEYTVPARGSDNLQLLPPQLLEGAVVQETYWELAVPWHKVAVGAPSSWIDENQWYWDRYAWKRRPWKNADALAAWAGAPTHTSAAEVMEDPSKGGFHSYLFHCEGPPEVLRLPLLSRAWLVGVCSGVVLALGVLLLVWRPSAWLPALLVAALLLTLVAMEQPSLALLVAQSSLAGLVLTALAAFVQRAIEKRRPHRHLFHEPGPVTPQPAGAGSSLLVADRAGSDDSTAIRIRTASTQEHVAAPQPPEQADLLAEGSKLEH